MKHITLLKSKVPSSKFQVPGFTLMEILVASAIFAGVMIVAVSAFAIVTRTQSKTLVNRQVSQTARLLNEQISRSARDAISEKVKVDGQEFVGFVGVNSAAITNPLVYNTSGISAGGADVLAVFSKRQDGTKMIEVYRRTAEGRIGYGTFNLPTNNTITSQTIKTTSISSYLAPSTVAISDAANGINIFRVYNAPTSSSAAIRRSPYIVLDYKISKTDLQVFGQGELQVKTTAVWRQR